MGTRYPDRMPPPVTTLRYLTRFRCIADACEDTCCAGMQILVSDDDRARKGHVLGASEAGRAELAQNLVSLPEAVHGYQWALARDEAGACRFLEPSRLCSLVRRFGDDVLSHSCAVFPRVVQRTPQRADVVAALACPEAARLCLLHEDAVDPVEATPDLASVAAGSRAAEPPHAEDEAVRDEGRTLILDRARPLAERLLALWSLGSRLPLEPDSAAYEETHTVKVVQALAALVTGLKARGHQRFNALVDSALLTYQTAALDLEPRLGQPGGPPLWPVLWRTFAQKRARALRRLGHITEPALERYWINDWHREPYTRSPSLEVHAFWMILRGAVLRFLLVGHPAVDGLAAHPAAEAEPASLPEAHRALLEGALVETVQLYAKHIERDTGLFALLEDELSPAALGTTAQGRASLFALAV